MSISKSGTGIRATRIIPTKLFAAGVGLAILLAGFSVSGFWAAFGGARQLAETKIAGLNLGGRQIRVGPNVNIQFLYILIDRVLIFYAHIINWAHGRRDYPEDKLIAPEDAADKAGFTSEWSSREKKICQSFLQTIRLGEDLQVEQSRKNMVGLLLDVMGKISGSRTRTI